MKTHDTMGRPIHRRPVYERVMEKTARRGGCLVYTGYCNAKGYGWVSCPGGNLLAHRVVFEHWCGKASQHVLHSCDNPPCVDIAHLWEGSAADNSADMVLKGRSPRTRGEQSGKAKLTNADVMVIHDLHALGGSNGYIAQRFSVHPAHISRIIHHQRRQWG